SDLVRPQDAGEDRVALVGPHELGALEGDARLVGVDADDHLDVGIALEGLGHAATPERAQPGDEDAPAHAQPVQMLLRCRSISHSASWSDVRIASASSMMRLFE